VYEPIDDRGADLRPRNTVPGARHRELIDDGSRGRVEHLHAEAVIPVVLIAKT